MAIDSALKRKAAAAVAIVFFAPGVSPDNTKPQAWRQNAGWGYSGIVTTITESTPFDDDTTDGAGNALTVTAFVNGSGYETRAPRLEHFHALDSARDADLHGYDRTELDRYRVKSLRYGHNPTRGYDSLRLYWVAKRAGERFSPRYAEVEVDVDDGPSRLAAVTTVRTNSAGYEMRYPTWGVSLSTDSARDVALSASAGTGQDRNRVLFTLPRGKSVGWTARLLFQTDGRAGNRFGVKAVVVEVDVTMAETPKARET